MDCNSFSLRMKKEHIMVFLLMQTYLEIHDKTYRVSCMSESLALRPRNHSGEAKISPDKLRVLELSFHRYTEARFSF